MLIDTHCHIHETSYPLDGDDVICRANQAGVTRIICVGTNETSSIEAVDFASSRDGVFAAIGIHPYYAETGLGDFAKLVESTAHDKKIVAIGEIGLDYYNNQSPREAQIKLLKYQIELALKYDLPIIFHVRDAYDDFWSVLDDFQGIRGVLHSFTDTLGNAEEGLKRGLYIGINGISTFTKDETQKLMYSSIPLDRIIFETDAPFLTPNPLRGKVKINEPAFIRNIAEYNSVIHQITFDEIANTTSANARALFNL